MGPNTGGDDLLEGDLDYDAETDEGDLALFLARYINGHPGADFDVDNDVDITDLQLFLAAYSQP